MKNLKTLLLIAVFTLGVGGVANAQKIGHVNIARVMANMPESRALGKELEKIGKTYKDDIEGMKNKVTAKIKKYQAEAPQQTEETNAQRGQELQTAQLKIRQVEQGAMQEMKDKENVEGRPIYEKMKKAIDEIAKTKGLTYVLNSAQTSVVLSANGVDIYNELEAKLGLLKDLPMPKQQN